MTAVQDPTARLAELVADSSPPGLPAPVMAAARNAVLDNLACAVHGATQPWTELVKAHVLAAAGEGAAPVYGEPRPSPSAAAALINGTAAHAYELDDIYLRGIVHPGAVVVPAAMAEGFERGSSLADVLAAVALGYEVLGRICVALGHWHNSRGFHTTGVIGPLGSAAACASLHDQPAALVEQTLGIAASFGGGIKAFQRGGGMIKRMHAGRAAAAGVEAARLAGDGFTGPTRVIEGPRGLLDVYGTDDTEPRWTLDEDDWVIEDIYFKRYATCSVNHSAAHATVGLLREHGLTHTDVAKVTVGTSGRGVEQNSIPTLDDEISAQYSLEYAVALALRGEAHDPDYFKKQHYTDRDRIETMSKIAVVVDEDVDKAYPETMAARVDITTVSGERHSRWLYGPPQERDVDEAWAVVKQKAAALLGSRLAQPEVDRVIDVFEERDPDLPISRLREPLQRFK